MDKPCSPDTVAFWENYCRARNVPQQRFDVCRMGSDPDMADELLALILRGPKRATACLLRDVEAGAETMARIDGHVVVLDGHDRARAIWRTRTVEVKPLNEVDEAFAWDEGEGERTREDWLAMHKQYFAARAVREGFAFDDTMLAIFERFTLVWPVGAADPEEAKGR
ncbi:ASCH domain-containing protein [Reyranella sp.]|uniref:ASCH domain-containing protein n=1 Tax=Reyranella sp. TaxID=1929291 RepID=UPI002F94E5C7